MGIVVTVDAAPPPRNRWFVDSPLEGTGFELLVRGRVRLVVGRRQQRNRTGSTKPLSMRIGELRSARTPHQGQEGKDIVVLDRWAEDRTEGAVSSPGIGIMKVPAQVPL